MILCLSFERSMVDARTRGSFYFLVIGVLLLYLWRSLGQKTNAAGVLAHVMHPLRPSWRDCMSLATTSSLATHRSSSVILARHSRRLLLSSCPALISCVILMAILWRAR